MSMSRYTTVQQNKVSDVMGWENQTGKRAFNDSTLY